MARSGIVMPRGTLNGYRLIECAERGKCHPTNRLGYPYPQMMTINDFVIHSLGSAMSCSRNAVTMTCFSLMEKAREFDKRQSLAILVDHLLAIIRDLSMKDMAWSRL